MSTTLDNIIREFRMQRDACDEALRALETVKPKRKPRRKAIRESEVRDAVLAFGIEAFTRAELAAALDAHPTSPSVARCLHTFEVRGMVAPVGRGRWRYVPPPKYPNHHRPVERRFFMPEGSLPVEGTGRRPRAGRHDQDEQLRRVPPSALERRRDGRIRVLP